MDKRIVALALGGLGIGTTEFAIMGLLIDVAQNLKITETEAGHLISAYAAGVVVGSPTLVALTSKKPPKKILIFLMILFTIFNCLSALMPNYSSLLFMRFLAGLPHGAYFGVATVVASRIAKPGKQAQNVAAIFTGLTLANVFMVPLVTYLGHTYIWRIAFFVVASIGVLTIISLIAWIPNLIPMSKGSLKEEIKFFTTAKAWHIILITAIGCAGFFTWLSYIDPLMVNVSKFPSNYTSYIMILAGVGMVVGNMFGGYLTDKMRPIMAAMIVSGCILISLLVIFFFSENQIVALISTFFCSAFSMAFSSPINIIMLRTAKNSEMMAAAFMQAAFNVANSLGALLGGIPLALNKPYNYSSLVGALMCLIGFFLCFAFYKKYPAVK